MQNGHKSRFPDFHSKNVPKALTRTNGGGRQNGTFFEWKSGNTKKTRKRKLKRNLENSQRK